MKRQKNKPQGKSKYGNKKVVYDGILFDSKMERDRYSELKMLEKNGDISDLELQKAFILIPAQREPATIGVRGGKKKGKIIEYAVKYVADFCYIERASGEYVVEDVKGKRTPEYIIKRKLMLQVYGIRIREINNDYKKNMRNMR